MLGAISRAVKLSKQDNRRAIDISAANYKLPKSKNASSLIAGLDHYFSLFRGQPKKHASNRKILVAIAHNFEDELMNEQCEFAFELLETRSKIEVIEVTEYSNKICYRLRTLPQVNENKPCQHFTFIATIGDNELINGFEIRNPKPREENNLCTRTVVAKSGISRSTSC